MNTRTQLKVLHDKDIIIKVYYLIIAISSTSYTPIRVKVKVARANFKIIPSKAPMRRYIPPPSLNEDSFWDIFSNIRNAVPFNELLDQFTQAIRPN